MILYINYEGHSLNPVAYVAMNMTTTSAPMDPVLHCTECICTIMFYHKLDVLCDSSQGNSNTFLLLFSAEHGHSKTVKALVETSTPVSD